MSLSKVREYIFQHENYKLCDGTMLYWEKKYSRLLSEFESKLTPKVKGRLHTDEVCLRVKKSQHYSVNTIDRKTKYNLATTFTPHRTKKVCREHFKKLWIKIGDQVKDVWEREKSKPRKKRKLITFVSDGFNGYRTGFNYYFYRFAKLVFGVPIACKKYGLKYNNNPVERYNETVKQRTKVMRPRLQRGR